MSYSINIIDDTLESLVLFRCVHKVIYGVKIFKKTKIILIKSKTLISVSSGSNFG